MRATSPQTQIDDRETQVRFFTAQVVMQNGTTLFDATMTFSSATRNQQAVESFCWRYRCTDAQFQQALLLANDMLSGLRGARLTAPEGVGLMRNGTYPVSFHHSNGFSEVRPFHVPVDYSPEVAEAAVVAFCRTGGCTVDARRLLTISLTTSPVSSQVQGRGGSTSASSDIPRSFEGSLAQRLLFPDCPSVFWLLVAEKAPASSRPARIAVIVPTLNAAETLREALGSVNRSASELAASVLDFSGAAKIALPVLLIVVDDGSHDGSATVAAHFAAACRADAWGCREWLDVRVVLLPKRSGAGNARNVGARHASDADDSDWWLAFLDADDVFAPTHLPLLM